MLKRKRTPTASDPGLEQIAAYEAAMIEAYDARVALGVTAAEIEQQRPTVVAHARLIGDQLRADYLARTRA